MSRAGSWSLVVLLLIMSSASAAPPPGQSALLNGMHDIEALAWMQGATAGCDKGWITDLRYIGTSGTPGAACHADARAAGISIIQRLDVSGSESYPHDPAQAPGYAQAFAAYAAQCADTHVWIVGNEPNFTVQKSDPDCSSSAYAAAYVAVHQKVHALPGHAADLVLVASNSPYSPGCLQSLRSIIDAIEAQGVTPDGFALHAYTRAGDGATLTAALVGSTQTQVDTTIDECPGGATWNDTWHSHFRIYRDYIGVIESRGLAGKPVFISESGNACDPGGAGKACYPNADVGYFQALYAEADAHNKSATTQTKIRAITPYRWTKNDDGTGRDFAIGDRPALLSDLQQAFAQGYAWTTPDCTAPMSCAGDEDCAGATLCDLGSARCVATQKCALDGSCKSGELCRSGSFDCVPALRGAAALDVVPAAPTPQAAILLDAHAPDGYANVGMRLHGPSGELTTSWKGHEKVGADNHWRYDATLVGGGTYRATFRADPAASTIYAIRYFNVGAVVPPKVDAGPAPDGGTVDAASPTDGPSSGDGVASPRRDASSAGAQLGGGCGCRVEGEMPPLSPLFFVLAAIALRRRRTAR